MVDYLTPTGLVIEGTFENERNARNRDLYKAVIREAHGVSDVIIAHHLVYVVEEKREDGFAYQIVEEIPSADTLIFNHRIAEKIWGPSFRDTLAKLAAVDCDERDKLFADLYAARTEEARQWV